MLVTGDAVEINEFKKMSAQDRVDMFNKVQNKFDNINGEMLEIMFTSKDYQNLDYQNWEDYVTNELPISVSTAYKLRKEFKEKFSKIGKITDSTESKLKEEILDAEYEDMIPLSLKEIEAKLKLIPARIRKEFSSLTDEQLLRNDRRIKEHGSKYVVEFAMIDDDIWELFIDPTFSACNKQNMIYLSETILKDPDFSQEEWIKNAKDIEKRVRSDKQVADIDRKHRAEAEERRVEALPDMLNIENSSDLAERVARYLFDNDYKSPRHFNETVNKFFKSIK